MWEFNSVFPLMWPKPAWKCAEVWEGGVKESFLFTTSPVLCYSLHPKNKQKEIDYLLLVCQTNNLWKGSDSKSNGSIMGEEQEGDSWPWTNYLNMQTSWERHRCPRLDDWRPGLHMCALCIWAFCLLWLNPSVPALKPGRYFKAGGWEENTVLSYFSCGAGLEGGCCVLGRLVVLEPFGSDELYFQIWLFSQRIMQPSASEITNCLKQLNGGRSSRFVCQLLRADKITSKAHV